MKRKKSNRPRITRISKHSDHEISRDALIQTRNARVPNQGKTGRIINRYAIVSQHSVRGCNAAGHTQPRCCAARPHLTLCQRQCPGAFHEYILVEFPFHRARRSAGHFETHSCLADGAVDANLPDQHALLESCQVLCGCFFTEN